MAGASLRAKATWLSVLVVLSATTLSSCTESSRAEQADDPTTTTSIVVSTTTRPATTAATQPTEPGHVTAGLLDTEAEVRAIAVGPSRLVAVGEDRRRGEVENDDAAAVWISSNGSTWHRVETDSSFVDGGMTDVVWYHVEEVFVAVGNHVSEGAIWTSPDGITWTRVALVPFNGPGGGIELDSIVVDGDGLLVIGREWLHEGEFVRARWDSTDAVVWERVDLGDSPVERG